MFYTTSFPSALQLRVSFDLLNNLPLFFSIPRLTVWFLNNLVSMMWGCQPHAQPPTWRTRVSLFFWLLPFRLSGMGDPTSSYATAGIALRVSGTLKPHHHDKVETPSVGFYTTNTFKEFSVLIYNRYIKHGIQWLKHSHITTQNLFTQKGFNK
jgi:hypothetical protein